MVPHSWITKWVKSDHCQPKPGSHSLHQTHILKYGCLGRILDFLAQGCFERQAALTGNTLWMKGGWGLHAKQCWQVRDSNFCQADVLNPGSHFVPIQRAQRAGL